ncbi:MAG: hypothetical protein AAF847_11200 [Bacteroidota bacterium]
MLNTHNHQSVVNQEVKTTSVLVPHEDCQQVMEIIKQSSSLSALKSDLHQSMLEIKEAEKGGQPLQSLQSLLDEN